MTVDIKFGKRIENQESDGSTYPWCEWPGEVSENDGTSREFTIFAGQPRRSFSNSGFSDWVERLPQARTVADLCWKDEQQFTPIDDTLLKVFDLLPENGSAADQDRARWFKYWARRAVQEFGSEAVIFFW